MTEQLHQTIEYRDELVLHGELLSPPDLTDMEGPIASYNPSPILTLMTPEGEASFAWARVEPDTAESYLRHTQVRLFQLHDVSGSTTLEPVIDTPILYGEDPSFFKIGDEYFVGVVELDEETDRPTTVFYQFDPETNQCHERLRGPEGQKDVRIAAVDPTDPSKGLVVYGRPDFGNDRRRITRVFITGFDDERMEEKLALLADESSVIGEALFEPYIDEHGNAHPTWGGVNYVTHITTETGEIYRVLGAHYAYFTDTDAETQGSARPRHYEGMVLVDTGDTLVKVCTFGVRSDFPDAAPKAGRDDLQDVCFLGGGSDDGIEGRWLYGLGDSRIGMVHVDAEMARHIIDSITQAIRASSQSL